MGTNHLVVNYVDWLRLVRVEVVEAFYILLFQLRGFSRELLYLAFLNLVIGGLVGKDVVLVDLVWSKI